MKKICSLILALSLLLCSCAFAAEVACVGDSLTYGVIPNTPGKQTDHPYPSVLAELLGDEYTVDNFGKPGRTLTAAGVSFLNSDAYQPSIDAKADMYIIMLGTNDANTGDGWNAADYEADLNALIDTYRDANPETVIVLMTPPMLFEDKATGELPIDLTIVEEINGIMKKVAEEKETALIDLLAETREHPEWVGDDGIHFLDDGYVAVGNIVYEQVKGML